MDIALVIDNLSETNGIIHLYDYLSQRYDVKVFKERNIKQIDAKLIITNIPEVVSEARGKVFFISTEFNFQGLKSARRRLIHNLKNAEEVFVFSKSAKNYFQNQLRINASVQYPYISPKSPSNQQIILHKNIPNQVVAKFSHYNLAEFKNLSDLSRAKILIYRPAFHEAYNIILPLASSYGVPCIVEDTGCLTEYVNSYDSTLSRSSSMKQWEDTIRDALKDLDIRSESTRHISLRFNNLIEIESKIRRVLNKNDKHTPVVIPSVPLVPNNYKKENHIRESLMKRSKVRLLRDVPPKQETKISEVKIKDTPSWFTNKEKVDISIIIPLYKSAKVIADQIRDWDFADDGIKKEIIYIDNNDPSGSKNIILQEWERHRSKLRGKGVGKIIECSQNVGYGPGNNIGAKEALGEYLLFLNADCIVTKDWIKPMFDLIKNDPNIGIVGNIQLSKDGAIDSAGSEFNWASGHFEHIGRNTLNGKRIKRGSKLNDLPKELRKDPTTKEMVTGCCMLVPRNVFFQVEGFDENYKIGYWEDTDLNMKIRELGYKVFLQPKSIIYHVGGHSGGGGHSYKKNNRDRFQNKWVNSGKIDSLVESKRPGTMPIYSKRKIDGKVVACTIACNEEEFLEVAIDSIASIVDEYVIVVGGNKYAVMSDMCHKNGKPKDDTLEIAYSLKDKYKNITIIEPPDRPWADKVEMRNAYVPYLNPNDWMFMLDADEVYGKEQLDRVVELMSQNEVLVMQYYLFWNNVNTLGTGAWSQYPQERIVKWKSGYHYRKPNHLFVADASGKEIRNKVKTYKGDEKLFYHYAYIRPIYKIRQKVDYYLHQLREEWGKKDAILSKYVDDIFLKWREDPNSIKETHPRGGGGRWEHFKGMHPYGVSELINEGKLNF